MGKKHPICRPPGATKPSQASSTVIAQQFVHMSHKLQVVRFYTLHLLTPPCSCLRVPWPWKAPLLFTEKTRITAGALRKASFNFCSFLRCVAQTLCCTDFTTFSPVLLVMTKNRVLGSSDRGLRRKPSGSAIAAPGNDRTHGWAAVGREELKLTMPEPLTSFEPHCATI